MTVASRKDREVNHIVCGIPAEVSLRSFTFAVAGLTYCAIDALTLLDHKPGEDFDMLEAARSPGNISLNDCTRWILSQQTTYLEEDEAEDKEQVSLVPQSEVVSLPSSPLGSPHATQFPVTPLSPPKTPSSVRIQVVKAPVLNVTKQDLLWAGFSGRTNKIADTCYCFWNTGALGVVTLNHF